jgi:hypothetical protein
LINGNGRLSERIIVVGYGFIVAERGKSRIEKLSSLSAFLHFFYDIWNEGFILLFGVLCIEDTIFFITQSSTSEAVSTSMTAIAVK